MINGLEILPDWLFLENEIVSGSYTSSTTGRFAPAVGMDASGHQSPWKQSIPSEQKPDRVKKTVVVNDFVLADPFYDSDDFVHKLNVLEQLIDAGFDQPEAQYGCPIAYTYSEDDIRELLGDAFKIVSMTQDHIFPYQIEPYKQGEYIKQPWFENMPVQVFRVLEKRLGWHLMITAKLKD